MSREVYQKYVISQMSGKKFHLICLSWQIFQSTPTEELPFWADVVLGFRRMTEAELKKFPQYVFGQAFTTLKCECPAYLPWLEKRSVEMLPAISLSVIAINHFVAIHKIHTEKPLPSLRALLHCLATHKWLVLCKTIRRQCLCHKD